jgi:hypothetical protein
VPISFPTISTCSRRVLTLSEPSIKHVKSIADIINCHKK